MPHPKSVLIERCQSLGLKKPVFNTYNTGPDHEPTFICDILISDEVYGTGQATKKGDAEKYASEEALLQLEGAKPQKASGTKRSAGASSARANGKTNSKTSKVSSRNSQSHSDNYEADFEGPWPMFSDVLASCITTANERADKSLSGDKAMVEVQRLSLKLYKSILEDLADIEEIEDEQDL